MYQKGGPSLNKKVLHSHQGADPANPACTELSVLVCLGVFCFGFFAKGPEHLTANIFFSSDHFCKDDLKAPVAQYHRYQEAEFQRWDME